MGHGALLDRLSADRRDVLEEFGQTLEPVFGADLLSASAFGGWLAGDPFYADAPARTVLVLRRIDLDALEQLAAEGVRLGQRGLAAPLIMTPAYIAASRDVFPLELLEIQQLHVMLRGEDHYAELQFDRADVRLACERELKSELIQMRQGLLAAAGLPEPLHAVCMQCAERSLRILRGVLWLKGERPAPAHAAALISRAAELTRLALPTHERLVSYSDDPAAGEYYRSLYAEIDALATAMDADGSQPAA